MTKLEVEPVLNVTFPDTRKLPPVNFTASDKPPLFVIENGPGQVGSNGPSVMTCRIVGTGRSIVMVVETPSENVGFAVEPPMKLLDPFTNHVRTALPSAMVPPVRLMFPVVMLPDAAPAPSRSTVPALTSSPEENENNAVVAAGNSVVPVPVLTIFPIPTAAVCVEANVILLFPEFVTLLLTVTVLAPAVTPTVISAPVSVREFRIDAALKLPLPMKISPPFAPSLLMAVAVKVPVDVVTKSISPFVAIPPV